MKKGILVFLLSCCLLYTQLVVGQVSPPQTQTPPATTKRKVIIQTPFGPKEIEEDVPVAPGNPAQQTPPQQAPATPAAPVTTAPAAPQAPPPAPTSPVAAPVTSPTPQLPAAAQDDAAAVQMQFDNADIYQFIRIIGDTLKLNYVIDPAVRGNVNINTSSTLRRSDLLPILETVLKMNGATMVRNGNFYQIVPAAAAIRQPLEIQTRENMPAVAPDDQMIVQIVRMKYVAPADMVALLTPYLSEGASISTQEAAGVLLISERRSNLRKLLEIIDYFDTNAFEGERVRIFELKYNKAKDLVNDLRSVLAGYALTERLAIRLVAIERLNSILVVTPNSAVFPEVERWIQRLDQPKQTGGIQIFVYKVKNSKAVDIQRVLAELYGFAGAYPSSRPNAASATQSTGGVASMSAAGLPPTQVPTQPPTPPPPGQQPAPELGRASNDLTNVKIVPDEINNALVIQATPQEYEELKKTIEELDLIPRQVLIDAQIYEVVLDNSLSLGISAILQNRGTLDRSTTAQFTGVGSGPASLTAQTFALIGRSRELLLFLNAQENRSRVKTLSAPSVLVSDNMLAQFQVGTEVPIPTTSSVTPVQTGGTNLFAQTIQFRNTGVILQVRPQINDSGKVTLDLYQEVSRAGANTVSAIVAPVIGKSSVTSTVVVEDGQTIALGGFMRESQDYGDNRVPILGRIPVLGTLLGNTQRSVNRSELIVLITPHVIRSPSDATSATDELKAKLKEIRKLIK
jgi:general secretion pathway protein D